MYDVEKLYKEYAQVIYKYLLCLTNNVDLSEDLTQETFYYAMQQINNFKGTCKVSVWLCQIAKYLWYGHIKKEKYKKIPLENIEVISKIDNEIENAIINKIMLESMYSQIKNLDDVTQKIILFRIKGNLSFREIGSILNKNETWVRVNFYRGKEKLKEENLHEVR